MFNGSIDRRPRGIAYCASTEDVARVVETARAFNQRVTVRSSGHNVAGRAVADDHVVIDVSALDTVRVLPAEARATCGPGSTWGAFDAATQRFGLATTGGTVTSTGVGGLTLGGGVGWLLPSYGLTCDNLLGASVITTDGTTLVVTDELNPDVMWALRGGGFGLGIVTSLEFELHDVRGVIGGAITYRLSDAVAVLEALGERLVDLDPAVMVSPALLYDRGAPVLEIDVAINGGANVVQHLLHLLPRSREPIGDTLRAQAYCTMQSMLDNPFRRGMHAYWKSGFTTALGREEAEVLVESIQRAPSHASLIMVEHYHGAYAEPTRPSAFPNRGDTLNVLFVANWEAGQSTGLADRSRVWAGESLDALARRSSGAYANYLSVDDGASYLEAPGLADVRKRLDPTGLLKWDTT